MDPRTMAPADIRPLLKQAGLDLNVQAGVEILRDFGNGSLLEWPAVTEHLVGEAGVLFVRWRTLADAYQAATANDTTPGTSPSGFIYLSGSARAALQIAIGLAAGRPVAELGYDLCRFDGGNAQVMLRAFGLCLHQRIGVDGELGGDRRVEARSRP